MSILIPKMVVLTGIEGFENVSLKQLPLTGVVPLGHFGGQLS